MPTILFQGIREISRAFSPEEPLKPELQRAKETVLKARSRDGALGFQKNAAGAAGPEKIAQVLAENGVKVTPAEAGKVDQELQREMIRRRFWIQLALTIVLTVFCLAMLAFGTPAAATEKSLFGLLGTILGYWLR